MISHAEAKLFTFENLVIDFHAHPVLKTYLFNYNLDHNHHTMRQMSPFTMHVDIPKILQGGVDVILSAAYLPERTLIKSSRILRIANKILRRFLRSFTDKIERFNSSSTPFEQTLCILKGFEDKIKAAQASGYKVRIAKSLSELKQNIENKFISFVHSIEGAHSLGRSLPNGPSDYLCNLNRLYDEGVCLITLSHFFENDISSPIDGIPPSFTKIFKLRHKRDLSKGLTPIGEKVVEEMLNKGIIVDLTHSTCVARKRVYEINKERGSKMRPVVFSHVGIHKFFQNDMNPTIDEILEIQRSNGVIGIIFMNYWLFGKEDKFFKFTPAMKVILNTIDHIKEVTGTYDNIVIGSDFDGFTDPSDDIKDISKIPNLTEALLNHGLPENEIKKILGLNVLRVLQDGWGKLE